MQNMTVCSLKSKHFMNFLIYNINSRQSWAVLGLWNTAIDDFPAEKKVIAFCTKSDMIAEKKVQTHPKFYTKRLMAHIQNSKLDKEGFLLGCLQLSWSCVFANESVALSTVAMQNCPWNFFEISWFCLQSLLWMNLVLGLRKQAHWTAWGVWTGRYS